jgi:hypothetical protein
VEAHELGPRLEGCDTDYWITIDTEQRVKVVIWWRQQGCNTDYRITIETEQWVKVVIRWRHTSRAPGSRDAIQIIEKLYKQNRMWRSSSGGGTWTGPPAIGCDTDYRTTIETEQSLKVVIRWRHMN